MSVSPKKIFIFYAGLSMQRSFEVNLGCRPMPSAQAPPDKVKGSLLGLFPGLVFPSPTPPPPENFSAVALTEMCHEIF